MPCEVHVTGGELDQSEINAYILRARDKFGRELRGIDITVDGDYVELSYHFDPVPFQRIRRSADFLVGSQDRLNDAKLAEERDRVKHSIPLSEYGAL